MHTAETIPGYTYGMPEVGPSPTSLEELDELERAIGFGPDDAGALCELWPALADRRDELFGVFMQHVARFFLPTFAGPGGEPLQAYVDAAHPRFLQWIEDTCLRPHDRDWLDYQHEIGLRHHRTKKNRTDDVDSPVREVPFRFLVAALYPLTSTVGPFLVARGVEEERASSLAAAWTKALVLQLALWSRPYVEESW